MTLFRVFGVLLRVFLDYYGNFVKKVSKMAIFEIQPTSEIAKVDRISGVQGPTGGGGFGNSDVDFILGLK